MRNTLSTLMIFTTILGCSEEPVNCKCNTSFVKENDSIVQSARLDSSIIKLDKRYNQELLEYRKEESYRIYIRHSLNKYFQVYTLVKNNERATLEVQEYVGSSGYSLDNRLDTSYSIELTKNEWSNIKKSIDSNCFWTLRFNDGVRHETLDGGEMILQGYQPDKRNCANSDYYLIVDWVSNDKRIYQIFQDIREYAREGKLHVL
jgi:hypothetical protein